MKNRLTYKISLCSLLSAFALIAFVLEGLFPPLFLPGARMGLSNVFILVAIYFLGAKYALVVLVIKTVLGSLFGGNISAVMYSLPSGLIALTIELVLIYFTKRVSIVAISVFGSVINVTAQNLIFCLVGESIEYLSYIPYLALIGIIAGVVVGFTVYLAVKKIPLPKTISNFEIQTENQLEVKYGENSSPKTNI
ncbi:MAG: Gx transporter family protein [Clostridiales bacterium]|nr:Gx transporter family protein [Clostridiales bacterium]